MPSNFDCLGFPMRTQDDLMDLLSAVLPNARSIAATARGTVLRWQDPSGARVFLTTDAAGHITAMTPSFDGVPSTLLADLRELDAQTIAAEVLDDDGDVVTRLAFDLEQRVLLTEGEWVGGRAAVVALGIDVRAHLSPEAFAASDASRFGDSMNEAGEPTRMAPESFISYGLFADPVEAEPYALLNGTVLEVTPKRNELSGEPFTVVRVRTVGMEVDLCVPPDEELPVVGGTMTGTVYLVGSIPELELDRQ